MRCDVISVCELAAGGCGASRCEDIVSEFEVMVDDDDEADEEEDLRYLLS